MFAATCYIDMLIIRLLILEFRIESQIHMEYVGLDDLTCWTRKVERIRLMIRDFFTLLLL